jgi:Tol biopolymer transport system component
MRRNRRAGTKSLKNIFLAEGIGICIIMVIVSLFMKLDHFVIKPSVTVLASFTPTIKGMPALSTTIIKQSLSHIPTPAGIPISSTLEQPFGEIVLTCSLNGYNQICLTEADGGNMTRLTSHATNDYYPSISRDGQTILFSSNRSGQFEIYSMSLDGSHLQQLTNGLYDVAAPELSPDGKSIVFSSRQDGSSSIWIMEQNGKNPHPLTDKSWNEIDPTWSADASQIAFASDQSGYVQLFVMNSDGTNLQQVSQHKLGIGGRSSWSIDGKSLVFYAGPAGDRDIYLLDMSTGIEIRLTQGGNNTGPCFSPDGNWIVFSSLRDADHEIFIMRTDGSQVTQLTFNHEDDWQPRWSQ